MKSELVEIELDSEIVRVLEEYCTSLYVEKKINASMEQVILKILEHYVEEEIEEREHDYFPIITGVSLPELETSPSSR